MQVVCCTIVLAEASRFYVTLPNDCGLFWNLQVSIFFFLLNSPFVVFLKLKNTPNRLNALQGTGNSNMMYCCFASLPKILLDFFFSCLNLTHTHMQTTWTTPTHKQYDKLAQERESLIYEKGSDAPDNVILAANARTVKLIFGLLAKDLQMCCW